MALLHQATIVPTKGELVDAWLPSRPWAPSGAVVSGVSYRLDDPAGEVGLEGFLLTHEGGDTVHVLLSYRDRPLDGAEQALVGTMEHSVLGARWVYDGCHDPVWIATLAATIVAGGTQAEELIDRGRGLERRDSQVQVRGSGLPGAVPGAVGELVVRDDAELTAISSDFGELAVVRRIGARPAYEHTLTATWDGHPAPELLAGFRPA